MAIRPYRFEVSEARSLKHPQFPDITKHVFLIRANQFPKNVPMEANPRDPVNMNRQVYRDVKASLRGEQADPGTFDLLNLGITIIAEEIQIVDKRIFDVYIDDDFGIANGGHTTQIIYDCQDDDTIAEGQHVEVKIITGLDRDKDHTLRVDIARAQNTGISVQPQSIFELDGAFDGIKEQIRDKPWFNKVGFKESDNTEIDVRDLVAVLELMNVIDFPIRETKHPISAYEKWSIPLKKFGEDFEKSRDNPSSRKYAALEPLLPEALYLYDVIRRDFLRAYNDHCGRAGGLRIVEKAAKSKGNFEFFYADLDPHDKRLTKGAAYPILGAFRNFVKVNPATNTAEWEGGFENVLKAWVKLAPELAAETKASLKDSPTPDSLGKNRNHWASLFKSVKVFVIEQKLDMLDPEDPS